jgi:hypothetical protein
MRLEIDDCGTFIPAFRKNKEQPATEQITVRYRYPTTAMKNRCRRKPQAKALSGRDGAVNGFEIIVEKDDIQTLNEMLLSISGCSYLNGDKKEIFITTAKELINAPIIFEPLLKEITAEFDRILDETDIDEKN